MRRCIGVEFITECTAKDVNVLDVESELGKTTTVLQVDEHWEPILCCELGESVAVEESAARWDAWFELLLEEFPAEV